jgi:hypothetical protein
MTLKKYIEMTSSSRDRTKYLKAGEFEVYTQSGNKDKFSAIDPVSDAAPIALLNNAFDILTPATTISGTVVRTTNVGYTSSPTKLVVLFTANQVSTVLNYYTGAILVWNDGADKPFKRITDYSYLDSNRGIFTLESAYSATIKNGDTVTITNPSDSSFIYIPSGSSIDNYYVNYYLHDETIGEYSLISYYDSTTKLAQLSSAFSGAWAITDRYCIRKNKPSEVNTLSSSTTSSFVLPAASNSLDNFYKGDFIRITSGTQINQIRRIITFTGSTLTGTVYPAFALAPGAATYEILQFTRDNVFPLNYTGSNIQEMDSYEIDLINVILPNKVLNSICGGKITQLPYVYVEFGNVNSTGSGQRGLIYSNNPNSVKMLFRATMDDTTNICNAPFIKIDGDKMTQSIRFKPNDNLKFSIRLPNGDIFDTIDSEQYSPLPPNPNIQISALFEIKSVEKPEKYCN